MSRPPRFVSYHNLTEWYQEKRRCPVCCQPSCESLGTLSQMTCPEHTDDWKRYREGSGISERSYLEFVLKAQPLVWTHECPGCETAKYIPLDDYLCTSCRDIVTYREKVT